MASDTRSLFLGTPYGGGLSNIPSSQIGGLRRAFANLHEHLRLKWFHGCSSADLAMKHEWPGWPATNHFFSVGAVMGRGASNSYVQRLGDLTHTFEFAICALDVMACAEPQLSQILAPLLACACARALAFGTSYIILTFVCIRS